MIILMFGRSGSGKSAISQNLITRMGCGREISGDMINDKRAFTREHHERNCVSAVDVVLNIRNIVANFPLIITLEAPTEACRVAFLRGMTLLNSKVYRVYVHASLELVEARDPKLLYARDYCKEPKYPMIRDYETPHNDDIDLILDSEACSIEKNAGFLWNFIETRA